MHALILTLAFLLTISCTGKPSTQAAQQPPAQAQAEVEEEHMHGHHEA